MKSSSDETWMNAASSGFRKPKRREQHAEPVDQERAREVLPDDAAAPASDPQRLDELEQIVAEEHDVRGLSRHVRSRAHRDPHVGLGQRGGVVDAVADHGDPLAGALAAREP